MKGCASPAPGRENTWINSKIVKLYTMLHRMGYAHSVEAFADDVLVGGLYGVSLGGAFFGESMFSRQTNSSKICLVHLVERLRQRGFVLLDTQFTTEHLKTFGAIDVPKQRYEKMLARAVSMPIFPSGEHSRPSGDGTHILRREPYCLAAASGGGSSDCCLQPFSQTS